MKELIELHKSNKFIEVIKLAPKYFDTHVEKLNKHLQTKCDVICEALDKNFGTTAQYHRPKGGIFIWVTLDKSIDILKLTHEAAKQGVAINAGP